MGKNTKVIELAGIPACGKTTLSKHLCQTLGNKCSIVNNFDAFEDYKRLPLVRKITCHNLFALFYSLLFSLILPFDGRHRRLGILNIYKYIVLNNYYKKYAPFDIVVIDHGFIQSLVSWQWGQDLKSYTIFSMLANRLAQYFDSEYMFYCKIPISIAVQRILQRGGTRGRLDYLAKNEPDRLAQYYKSEEVRFEKTILLLRLGTLISSLDMSSDIETIIKDIEKKIDYDNK